MKRIIQGSIVASLLALSILACQTLPFQLAESQPVDREVIVETVVVTQQPIVQVQSTPPVLGVIPDLVSLEETLVNIYETVNPGVVAIHVNTGSGRSLGSGFVIDQDGHIVTNYHVVENGRDLEVSFPSGFKVWGEVLGTDTDSDLAVIKVEAPPEQLRPLTLGDSSNVKVGQTVVAIGNPFGLSGTMTVGIISGQGRTLDSLRASPEGGPFAAGDIIQTDAAINPGNSGGPLLNLNGEVIGVNRAIRTVNFTLTEDPVNSGIGFAVAINIVKRVVPALISDGEFDYPYLGISSRPEITLQEQEALGLPQATGAYVTSVVPGSPADQAGLRGGQSNRPTSIPGLPAGGDLIIAIDDVPVLQFSDLLSYLFNHKSPDEEVTLTILRDGEMMDIDLVLGKRPGD